MRHFGCLILVLTNAAWLGCGHKGGLEGTIAASGTVTYNGQPVAGATVVFSPVGPGRAASGLTDGDGRFKLQTLSADDGILPGKYQVAISKTEIQNPLTEAETQAYIAQHGEPPQVTVKEALPAKYKSGLTSTLSADVTAGEKNEFTFNLQD